VPKYGRTRFDNSHLFTSVHILTRMPVLEKFTFVVMSPCRRRCVQYLQWHIFPCTVLNASFRDHSTLSQDKGWEAGGRRQETGDRRQQAAGRPGANGSHAQVQVQVPSEPGVDRGWSWSWSPQLGTSADIGVR
jgi:hypothetical protein